MPDMAADGQDLQYSDSPPDADVRGPRPVSAVGPCEGARVAGVGVWPAGGAAGDTLLVGCMRPAAGQLQAAATALPPAAPGLECGAPVVALPASFHMVPIECQPAWG